MIRVCVIVSGSYHYVRTTQHASLSTIYSEALEVAVDALKAGGGQVIVEFNVDGTTVVLRN